MSDSVRTIAVRVIIWSISVLVTMNSHSANVRATSAADLSGYALCDLRVMYLFDDAEKIDWPTLYYLNEQKNCRVDLVTFGVANDFRVMSREITDREIFWHTLYFDADDSMAYDSAVAHLFAVRRPDILILGEVDSSRKFKVLEHGLLNLPSQPGALFDIVKVYRASGDDDSSHSPLSTVVLNRQEMYDRFRQRMQLEIPSLIPGAHPDNVRGERLTRYDLVRSTLVSTERDVDFLSGLRPLRLTAVLDSVLLDGTRREAFRLRSRNFVSLFGFSLNAVGRDRVDKIMSGFRELSILVQQAQSETELTRIPGFIPYLERLATKAQRAVLHLIGIDWEGRIILRDSPHGPKLKFQASLAVNGPQEVELSYIQFHPYWDSVAVSLDSVSRLVRPHQAFVREYLVDIERLRLEAQMPESLVFTAEVVYGRFPMIVTSKVPVWEAPELNVQFQPDFHFIQPFARLNIDKVVASMNWKVIIEKPRNYCGKVKLDLETPRGVFAGAYQQELQLEKGSSRETVRVPFSVSNLFELGIQRQTAILSVEGRPVAVDSGIIRIASCRVADTIKVGFLPDTTGLLEDILRMTDAAFQPLTDRGLLTGDLDAYNVIIIGSGALRSYPSFRQIRGRIEEYVRYGGSLIVFGQPRDWPDGVLSVSLVPAREALTRTELLNRIPDARILNRPHVIDEEILLQSLTKRQPVSAAIVSPAEQVYVTPTGSTLLSVSRLGSGQVIYCGLALTEMISELNLEAIHLFANILNY